MKAFRNPLETARKAVLFFVVMMGIAFTAAAGNKEITAPLGITLNGAEFGQNSLPGVLGKDYTFPTENEVRYFAAKGVHMIQLPVRWERLQHTLGANLDINYLNLVNNFINTCKKYNVEVIVTLQNYGRYKINNIEYTVGTAQVPYAQYRAFWKKFAATLKNHNNIHGLDIMAEPYNMGEHVWGNAAQEAIFGIREVDTVHTIIVDGNNYACAEKWVEYSDELKYLEDPYENMLFDAHCYFDQDRSGTYANGYEAGMNNQTGVQKIAPFINWLKANHKKGYVGEFGVPKNDARFIPMLDNFLNYIQQNNIGGCYWAAGPWWNNYSLSIEPMGGKDQPQMTVLNKYLTEKNTYAYNN